MIEVRLDLSAFRKNDQFLTISLPESLEKSIPLLKTFLLESGIRHDYMIFINGRFASVSKDPGLQRGDTIKLLPVIGGG